MEHSELLSITEAYRQKILSKLEAQSAQIPVYAAISLENPCRKFKMYKRHSSFKGRRIGACRLMYQIFYKVKLLPEIKVRHKCKTKGCLEISHLETGTSRDNMLDKSRDGTSGRKLTNKQALIIYLLRGWATNRERGALFNVTSSTVNHIDHGRTYSNVTGKQQPLLKKRCRQEVYDNLVRDDDQCHHVLKRLLSLTEESQCKYNNTPCLKWTGCTVHGYGTTKLKSLNIQAQVLGYLLFHCESFDVSDKLQGCHLCGNAWCVNGLHVYMGTALENAYDKLEHGTLLKGIQIPYSKINDEIAQQIKISKGEGTQKERAKRLNVPVTIVRGIDCGRTWRHV